MKITDRANLTVTHRISLEDTETREVGWIKGPIWVDGAVITWAATSEGWKLSTLKLIAHKAKKDGSRGEIGCEPYVWGNEQSLPWVQELIRLAEDARDSTIVDTALAAADVAGLLADMGQRVKDGGEKL